MNMKVLNIKIYLTIIFIWFLIELGEKQIVELSGFSITFLNMCSLITIMAGQCMLANLTIETKFLAIEDG